jgi:hypothetical protein
MATLGSLVQERYFNTDIGGGPLSAMLRDSVAKGFMVQGVPTETEIATCLFNDLRPKVSGLKVESSSRMSWCLRAPRREKKGSPVWATFS